MNSGRFARAYRAANRLLAKVGHDQADQRAQQDADGAFHQKHHAAAAAERRGNAAGDDVDQRGRNRAFQQDVHLFRADQRAHAGERHALAVDVVPDADFIQSRLQPLEQLFQPLVDGGANLRNVVEVSNQLVGCAR